MAKYKKILQQINDLKKELKKLQLKCRHPKMEERKPSYSYSESEGVYYSHNEDCCASCGISWSIVIDERNTSW